MNTLARIKKFGKNFEIIVDLDSALQCKKGETDFIEAQGDKIFSDSKKGQVVSSTDLQEAFNTTDVNEIAKIIVTQGEVQTTQEHRDEERDKKVRQVVEFLAKNAVDPQTKNPHTPERLKSVINEAGINIKDVAIEKQIGEIVEQLSNVLPIAIEKRKVKIVIPAIHTGKAYGVISTYKEKETWLDNGDLEVIVSVPSGMIIDFYDKLNKMTHGSSTTEELKED